MTCRRIVVLALGLVAGWFTSVSQAALIFAGAPTTSVPTYLTDGSYLFGITVSLGADQFLLPVEITGATGLQSWQFDLSFNNTVVEEVDPGDGSSGIYGARFTSGDADSLSFILAGFPLNPLGQVLAAAGSYPNLLSGPSGDGVLSYLLFQFLRGQTSQDPGFGTGGTSIVQLPEPGSLALFGGVLLICSVFAQRWAPHRPWR
jgi:hypothetical protein